MEALYSPLLTIHSLLRWAVLAVLVYAVIKGFSGWFSTRRFTGSDNLARTLGVIFTHLQVVIGLILYFISPIVKAYWAGSKGFGFSFFGIMHGVMMLIAVVVVTIGSARIRKATFDRRKFAAMAIFFGIALVLILSSIPWPFMGDAGRVLYRFDF